MENLIKASRFFYGIGIARIGFQQFIYADFRPVLWSNGLLPPRRIREKRQTGENLFVHAYPIFSFYTGEFFFHNDDRIWL
jgi:hypothetical protein